MTLRPRVAPGSELAPADITARIRAGAARYLTNGTTAIRVHVDVGKKAGPWAVEALLDARSSLAGILDIQIVAAISAPVSGPAGAASRAPLRHALAAGADLAGAGPGLVDETGRTVENLAVMAADAGAGLDVHIDETAGSVQAALPRLMGIGVVILPRSGPFQRRGGEGGAPPGQVIMRDLLKAGVPARSSRAGGRAPRATAASPAATPLQPMAAAAHKAMVTCPGRSRTASHHGGPATGRGIAATAALGPAADTPIMIRTAVPMATVADQEGTCAAWAGKAFSRRVRARAATPDVAW